MYYDNEYVDPHFISSGNPGNIDYPRIDAALEMLLQYKPNEDYCTDEMIDTLLVEDFQNGWNSWQFYYNKNNACAAGYIVHDGYPNYVFHGYISADGSETYDVELYKTGIPLIKDHSYTIQFDARGIYGRDRDINVVLKSNATPWTNYSNAPFFHLTYNMTTYEYTFTMNHPTDMTRLSFEMGECSDNDWDIPNEVVIDNIVVIKNP